MFNGVVLTKMNFIDKATRRYEWDGSSYPTPSRYGGEVGYNFPSDSDDQKLSFINKTNLEYIINERHSFNFNSVFSIAKGTPKDELKDPEFRQASEFRFAYAQLGERTYLRLAVT